MEILAEAVKMAFGPKEILKGIDFSLHNKEFVGIIGPNGSGKSTFLKCVYRVQKPTDGKITFNGTPLDELSYRESALQLAVVAQHNVYSFDFSVLEVVLMGRSPHKKMLERDNLNDYRIAREALATVGLADFEERSFATLSGGEQQRVILARALTQQTECLVLDEPTNDLDIVTLNVLEEYLQNFKGCVIVVSHDRYFMDKVVDHLLVFNGQGDIRDFPGNYTQYRDWKDAKVHQEKEKEKEAAKAQEDKTAKVRLNEKRRMSFKEKREFEQLEQEIADLETEKNAIEEALCSGTLSVDELTEKSKRLPELSDLIDEKTLRWLELSEIESN